ncbi:MAG: arsenate reductase ArsC [Candidatus Thermoplasmatota archaeon]|nr:arsenate reductase ArsC [Candidatus Thermoplasmatota archaeon]MEC7601432.1 arsenate reductase ArsC [Candidatus Thermoplasmatota archaeon]MED5375823.1 arsenate reductase ArsC [Candidatus Thermoplasmatota archaeon]
MWWSIATCMKLLFVCVGNSCRSQMAEGIARSLGHEAASAGTHPATLVSPNAVLVCAEIGIDISNQQPKSVDNFFADDWDAVISMGCGVSCPAMKIDEDWELDDPVGQSIEVFRETRDAIRDRILRLTF